MSVRRLRVLIQKLPPESHTLTALRNDLSADEYEAQGRRGEPEKGRWSQAEQILAGISDSLRRLEYILIVANSDGKGRKPQRPEPMRRPGVEPHKKLAPVSEKGAETLFRLINGGATAA